MGLDLLQSEFAISFSRPGFPLGFVTLHVIELEEGWLQINV